MLDLDSESNLFIYFKKNLKQFCEVGLGGDRTGHHPQEDLAKFD
jgi:hypothetical protein